MSILYFWKWKNYENDVGIGKAYYLIQDNKLMLNLKPEQHIWAFTRLENETYILAADLVVSQTTDDSPEPKYGHYCAYADKLKSRYFKLSHSSDVEPVIKQLNFYAQKRTPPRVKALGSLFQGLAAVKELTPSDEQKLTTFSSKLATI